MKSKYGMSNLDIIKCYLNGERPFAQIGYGPMPKDKKVVGEEWKDEDGREWVQEKKHLKISKKLNILRENTRQFCKKCNMDIFWAGNRYDQTIFNKTGFCHDCLIQIETNINLIGKWKEYEEWKISSNKKSFVLERICQLNETLESVKNWDGIVKFLNEDGSSENWDKVDRTEIIEKINNDIKLCEEELQKLTKIIEDLENVHSFKELVK